jgi:hypothetical protein
MTRSLFAWKQPTQLSPAAPIVASTPRAYALGLALYIRFADFILTLALFWELVLASSV